MSLRRKRPGFPGRFSLYKSTVRLFVAGHFAGKLDKRLYAKSGSAVFRVLPSLGHECRTGDVPVCPGGVFGHEFLEEECCRDGASVASRILEVGELVLEGVGVFFFERHAPELFAAGFAAVNHLQAKVIVIAEESRDGVTEGTDHGARKGGKVHNVGGTDFARFGKSVAENQAAVGVGVVDHDGLAVLTWENRLIADCIFGEAADGAHANRELEGGDSLDGGERGRCATHVANHFGHGFRRFQAEAAGIKRETLADNHQVILGSALCGLVFKRNHVRLVRAAFANGHVTHEAFLFELLHVADLDAQAFGVLGNCLGAFHEFGGVEVGGTSVNQVLGERHGLLFHGYVFGDLLEILFHGALGQAVGGHTQVIEGRKAAFLGCVHKNGVASVDFEVFEVFKRAVVHAVEYRFYLGKGCIGEHLGKLDRLLDKKEGVCLIVGVFEIFRGNDIQIHAQNVVKLGA